MLVGGPSMVGRLPSGWTSIHTEVKHDGAGVKMVVRAGALDMSDWRALSVRRGFDKQPGQ
jgi:hypothetical protein